MSALSLADAKAWLGITASTSDVKLQGVIDAAEGVIGKRCGWLSPTAATTRIRANGSPSLLLPASPVAGLTSISASDGSALAMGDLYLDESSGVITRNDGTAFWASYYDVTYMAGRSEVPDDLLQAIKELVQHLWSPQRGPSRRPGAMDSEMAANTLPGAGYLLPFRVLELIAPYETPGFA